MLNLCWKQWHIAYYWARQPEASLSYRYNRCWRAPGCPTWFFGFLWSLFVLLFHFFFMFFPSPDLLLQKIKDTCVACALISIQLRCKTFNKKLKNLPCVHSTCPTEITATLNNNDNNNEKQHTIIYFKTLGSMFQCFFIVGPSNSSV